MVFQKVYLFHDTIENFTCLEYMIDGYKYLSGNRYDGTFLATTLGSSTKFFCIVATFFILDSSMCNLYEAWLEIDTSF